MSLEAYRRAARLAQLSLLAGLGLALAWRLAALAVALPGLALGLWLLISPRLRALRAVPYPDSYRLVYDAGPDWPDAAARQALLTLARRAGGIDIVWRREGEGIGCWLALPEQGAVLGRLVGDMFPGGQLETDDLPRPAEGATILRWRQTPPPPAALCALPGIDGVYYRRQTEKRAIVSLWGPKACALAQALAAPDGWLPGEGQALRRPRFSGDNPWPALPPFPPSRYNPALAAVCRVDLCAPELAVSGPALSPGQDDMGSPLGFPLPELSGAEAVWALGQSAETMAVNLAVQAVRAGIPTCFLDGRGSAAARLARRLLREVAAGRLLISDIERPAQSHFRLNPFWLPPERAVWPGLLPLWRAWLRQLGVTPAGLGRAAYRHTLAAAILSAVLSADQEPALDPPALQAALEAPAFLARVDESLVAGETVLGSELWHWWLREGRPAPNFEVHLRLGHLRDRLASLLKLPEYSVLWQSPYEDPLAKLAAGSAFCWRLPDPRGRLREYVTSQLLALASLLNAWRGEQPALVILHELAAGPWAERLSSFPAARLVLAAEQLAGLPRRPEPVTLLVSRLNKNDAEKMAPRLPGLRPAGLRRMPPDRLVMRRGAHLGSATITEVR